MHLSAAADADIVVHERAAQAGGRRRSFYDEALGLTIDSGNYFVLSSWRSALSTIAAIGAAGQWREEPSGEIPFADMSSGERWKLRPNAGPIPWWVLSIGRRAPRTLAKDYFQRREVAARAGCRGPRRFRAGRWAGRRPYLAPVRASRAQRRAEPRLGRLAGALLRETLRGGGRGARMMFPVGEFARAFVEPALRRLQRREVAVRFERELRALEFDGDSVVALDFEHDRIDLAPADALILAVPPWTASALAPGISAPTEFAATLTAHFAMSPTTGTPRVLGVVNGPFPWMFCYPDRISVGVRDAGAALATPREQLAAEYWRVAAALTGLSDALPAWRIIRQKRAGFLATPAQDALRPSCETPWRNLFLAGAYVQNGLPESIESSLRSGEVAARCVAARRR